MAGNGEARAGVPKGDEAQRCAAHGSVRQAQNERRRVDETKPDKENDPMKVNLATLLAILGGLGVFAPDVAGLAAWLATMHIGWLAYVVRGLGFVAALFAAMPIMVPRLRAFLSLFGLATAPGAQAPWEPSRDKNVVPAPGLPLAAPPAGPRPGTGYPPGPKAAAVLILGASLLLAGAARAQTPALSQQFGGCFAQGQVCLGPSASITLGELNLATSKFSGGIIPGVGYGATYAQDQWYATGLSLYFSFKAGQDGPNQAIPSLVLSFANYVRVGTGVAITETSGPVQTQWLLLFGLGSDFGGSPKYQQTQLKASMGGK